MKEDYAKDRKGQPSESHSCIGAVQQEVLDSKKSRPRTALRSFNSRIQQPLGPGDHQDRASIPSANDELDERLTNAVAFSLLGEYKNAPTVRVMMATQGHQMSSHKWQIVKEILERHPQARTDLACLARLLEGSAESR